MFYLKIRDQEEEEGAEDSVQRPLVFAYYVTGHGFGHATRAVELHRHLSLSVSLCVCVCDLSEKMKKNNVLIRCTNNLLCNYGYVLIRCLCVICLKI
ncbi:hypothetical protein ABFX02_08G132900 [Erythranthe guttata]